MNDIDPHTLESCPLVKMGIIPPFGQLRSDVATIKAHTEAIVEHLDRINGTLVAHDKRLDILETYRVRLDTLSVFLKGSVIIFGALFIGIIVDLLKG